MMTGDDWQRVEALFTAALAHPAHRRAGFVSASTADPALSREVLSLLAAHEADGPADRLPERLAGALLTMLPTTEELVERLRTSLASRYRIERELGRGGMAVVLLAEDLKHHRPVAVKILQPELAMALGGGRFLQEIAIAARLSHPHILPLHDSGDADGLLYFVMPYVEGESLRERLRRQPVLPVDEAVRIARQAADALEYAHGRGIVHRDIKPENLLLQGGHALISDFGIARAMQEAGRDDPGESGPVLGTPAYMSPEQTAAGIVDGRSDVFSLGCVLFEMLAGQPPFAARTLEERRSAPAPLARIPSRLPAWLGEALQRSLAEAPADRFPSAAAFGAALEPGLRHEAPSRPVTRRRVGWILTGLAAGGLAAAARLVLPGPPIHPAAERLAVLPMVAAATDTTLTRLARDLVLTLSATLERVEGLRVVDAQAILAQTRSSGPLALEPAARLAALLGATGVVHGLISAQDDRVRVDLGLFTTDGASPVARVSASAHQADLNGLTDSLTGALLHEVRRSGAVRPPTLAEATTRSLPALTAYLEGERASLEDRWNAAAEAYARAIRADPEFWMAYWRYAFASWWYLEAVDDSVLAVVRERRHALPDRDRLVYESWVTDTFALALSRAREATDRFPDFWPAWMQLGDWLMHVGPVYGHGLTEAAVALERAVTLNPSFLSAWEHLFWVSLPADTTAAARALDALVRLGFGPATTEEFGFDVGQAYRLDLHWARTRRLDHRLLDSVARALVSGGRGRLAGGVTLPAVQVALSRRVLAARPADPLALIQERALADAWASRGAWDSAVTAALGYGQRHGGAPALDAYRYAALGLWLGALGPEPAIRARSLAIRAATSSASSMLRAEVAWLDGLRAAGAGDRRALAAAREAVRQFDTLSHGLLDSTLAAFDLRLGGADSLASRWLATLNWSRPDLLVPGYAEHPYLIAVSRLGAARWFVDRGDAAEAARLLDWFEAAWAFDGYRPARRVLLALASRERARLAERQGHGTLAQRELRRFLDRYDHPSPGHRRLVDEARARLARR